MTKRFKILALLALGGCSTSSNAPLFPVEKQGLSDKQIVTTLKGKKNEFQKCFEISLNQNPDLLGRLALDWTILGNGDVERVNLTGNSFAKDYGLSDCVITKIYAMKFPPSDTGSKSKAAVTLPFGFDDNENPMNIFRVKKKPAKPKKVRPEEF